MILCFSIDYIFLVYNELCIHILLYIYIQFLSVFQAVFMSSV